MTLMLEHDTRFTWHHDAQNNLCGARVGLGRAPCSFGLSATSQQYFSFETNQPSTTSQQYFSLRINQHQPPATSQTNRLVGN
jgi:hypothetical protein